MNFDLNGEDFKGSEIKLINNGEAGLVPNVTIAVERRGADEPTTYPDYKLIVTDEAGGTASGGFYIPTENPAKTPDENKRAMNWGVSRVLSIARAVMGKEYEFPPVDGPEDAFKTLFKIVNDNAGSKKFNAFVTYGTSVRPSKYLNLRFFDFIESADGLSRLREKGADNMVRITPDEPKSAPGGSTESWD